MNPGNWIARHVYCELCGTDWAAIYEVPATSLLECPACGKHCRIRLVSRDA